MQFAFIVTDIEVYTTENSGQTFTLSVRDHLARQILLAGNADQQINILTVRQQVPPFVMLTDQMQQSLSSVLHISEQALVSVVPFPASTVQSLLDTNRADELLNSFRTVP